MATGIVQMSEEVAAAVAAQCALVALESTVIAHGLPRPLNLETARRLEALVREGGGVPATIAILEGRLKAGLSPQELARLAEEEGVHKVSRRDLPLAVARAWAGATTVAATMWIAHRAGIEVFATGGIGGVHRGSLPDISADLPELAATPMVVVCSGAKIVLDLAATREWLETHGVSIIGYGCDYVPAFYLRRTELPVDVRVDAPEEVAEIAEARRQLGTNGALLVTVPVPAEAEMDESLMKETLAEALAEAESAGVGGRELTPFLLSRMGERSRGATLRANVALLENNARVAVGVARAIAERRKSAGRAPEL